jgi:hypothetical protein
MQAANRNSHRARKREMRIAPRARWLVLMLCLVGMAVQSLIVQTHLHAPVLIAGATAATAQDVAFFAAIPDERTSKPAQPHVPIDEDQNCPICQQFHGAGQFFAPSAPLFALPAFVNVRFVTLDTAHLATHPPSQNWRGRAPPIA